jgi:hypothetical protein
MLNILTRMGKIFIMSYLQTDNLGNMMETMLFGHNTGTYQKQIFLIGAAKIVRYLN